MYRLTLSSSGSFNESERNNARLYHHAARGMSLAATYASPRLAHTLGRLLSQSLPASCLQALL